MPLTFPSHAAAVLPLMHIRGLPARALVVGSTAPDLVYLVGTLGATAHHPRGLLSVCLPAGVLAYLYLEALVLPVVGPPLISSWPDRGRALVARLARPRPRPRSVRGWLAVGLAVLVGAATHQLWDGFTHAWMWPARVLYPTTSVSLLGHPVLLSKVLQHGSSALGLVIVCVYLWRTTAADARPPPSRAAAVRRLAALLAGPLVVAGVAACVRLRVPDPLLTRALWDAAWSAAAWSMLALGLVCLGVRCLDFARRQSHE